MNFVLTYFCIFNGPYFNYFSTPTVNTSRLEVLKTSPCSLTAPPAPSSTSRSPPPAAAPSSRTLPPPSHFTRTADSGSSGPNRSVSGPPPERSSCRIRQADDLQLILASPGRSAAVLVVPTKRGCARPALLLRCRVGENSYCNLDRPTMETACTNLTQVVRSVRLLKIDGFNLTAWMGIDYCFKSRWNVDGYEWEILIYPSRNEENSLNRVLPWVALRLVFLSEPRACSVRTTLRCRLVDPRGILKPSNEHYQLITFKFPQDSSSEVVLMARDELVERGYANNDSITVQCTLEVLKELPDVAMVLHKEVPLPSPNLHRHLAELLQSETGADVTFLVSGESFAAHKAVLAARSPVFMAEFFGDMKEKCSRRVEIENMEAAVFKALLHFIYTDTLPEFEQQKEAATVMAQHLLAAADRYGLDRLKLICVLELSGGINVDTAATTLALAEQHNCPELKAKFVEFIIRTPVTLDAVLVTEGYKHLEASCPLVVIDLLKSARGRKT